MIAVDSNVLARFYCDDPDDPEAVRQRPAARRLLLESAAIYVPTTVVREFEWVMRGFYGASRDDVCRAIDHRLGLQHVTVERSESVKDAIDSCRSGMDFADSLHRASSRHGGCSAIASFDRRFARAASAAGLRPTVTSP